MRKLAFATFAIYLSILLTPLSFAASSVRIDEPCRDGKELTLEDTNLLKNGDEAAQQTVKAWYTTHEAEKNVDGYYDINRCGLPKDGEYQKGDCSTGENAKYIVEISEPIGGSVSSESTGGEGEVIPVYKGICCLLGGSYETTGTGSTQEFYCDQTEIKYFDSYKTCAENAQYCQAIQWLISDSGIGIIKTYVKQIYVYGAGIVGFIAVAVIVGSGIQISVSGASGDITAAKDRIIQSLMGIALLFLSALILYTINPTFFK
ncbi:hypothetical protein HY463_01295 [Candidatus Peregrinibacteria bacterium]|nr:hypothetical protein [Candidatus Peregrinibacteria bacterium]